MQLLKGGRHQGDGRPTGDRFERSSWRQSVPPKVLKPRRAQCRVARGVGDRDVAEPILYGAGVDAVIGERLRFTRAALAHHSSIWRASLVAYLSRPTVLDRVDAHSLHRPQW
jgi:hypothetical protein